MKYLLLLALALALPACALTYPSRHGNVTLQFEPTPEMLDHMGVRIHPVNRDKK